MGPEEYVQAAQDLMPDGWEVESDAVLVCPCGDRVEWDGGCPQGHVSPLRTLGLI